jgi:type VI protein secretion system component Hcp
MASTGSIDAFLTFSKGRTDKRSYEIKGETEDTYEQGFGSCQLLDYSLGFSLEISPGRETDSKASEKATHEASLKAVQLTKQVDSASPIIMQAMVEAARFEWICIWQKKAGAAKGKSGEYFWKVFLYDCYISELGWKADSDSLSESLSIEYKKIEVEYYKQLHTGLLENKAIKGEYTDIAIGSKKDGDSNGADADAIEKRIFEKLKALNPSIKVPGPGRR